MSSLNLAELARILFAQGGDALFLFDAGQRLLDANPAAQRLTGCDRDALIGQSADALLAAEAGGAPLRLAAASPSSADALLRSRPEGVWIPVRLTFTPLEAGQHPAVLVAASSRIGDDLARLRAEEALRHSETVSRTLLENLEQGIFLKDAELRFVAANRRFCENVGCSEAQLRGRTDLDFFPPALAEKYRADDRRVLCEGRRLETEEEAIVQGRRCVVRVIKTPLLDADGRAAGVLGIYWDVTEQHLLEEQLRQAQKMEAVGQLAGGVAHDFNNLLTAILGNLSLVQSGLDEGHPARLPAAAAERAAWRAANLTSQLLGFSRRKALRPQPLSLNAALEEMAALLGRTIDPRISLRLQPGEGLWLVFADPNQINHALMNLCLNARDAVAALLEARPDGAAPPRPPQLLLETANFRLGEAEALRRVGARPGEFVRLRVCDNGGGIPAEVLPRIYEPFFTTKGPDKGTGLGLSLVLGVVQQHHGWIECRSTVGEGTCFDLFLPRHAVAAADAPSPARPLLARGHETVLLADDEQALRALGQVILQRQGYRVLLAGDGQEALEVFQREGGGVALVVLDLSMPRLSGRDALRELRRLDPGVRVLIASGYAPESLSDEEHEQISGFVGKPFRAEDFAAAVRAALDRSPTDAAPRRHAPAAST
jgi:PAS domain S-box-containing protein